MRGWVLIGLDEHKGEGMACKEEKDSRGRDWNVCFDAFSDGVWVAAALTLRPRRKGWMHHAWMDGWMDASYDCIDGTS